MSTRATFVEQLRALPSPRRRPALLKFIRSHIADALCMEETEIGPRDPLMGLGISSMRMIELKILFERELLLTLQSTVVFDYGTMDQLTDFLLSLVSMVPDAPETSLESTVEPKK